METDRKSGSTAGQRLESLDVLRGFDLFCLVALEGILYPLGEAVNAGWFDSFMWCFSHVEWEGFSPWDLVMPLFMFMSGVTIPFALSRYRTMTDKSQVYKRIARRVLLLWIFGMMCQGNLLGLDPDRIYLYSNTLQAIAMGFSNPGAILVIFGLFAFFGIGPESPGEEWSVLPVIAAVFAGATAYWFCITAVLEHFRKRIRLGSILWINRITGITVILIGLALLGEGLYRVIFLGIPLN